MECYKYIEENNSLTAEEKKYLTKKHDEILQEVKDSKLFIKYQKTTLIPKGGSQGRNNVQNFLISINTRYPKVKESDHKIITLTNNPLNPRYLTPAIKVTRLVRDFRNGKSGTNYNINDTQLGIDISTNRKVFEKYRTDFTQLRPLSYDQSNKGTGDAGYDVSALDVNALQQKVNTKSITELWSGNEFTESEKTHAILLHIQKSLEDKSTINGKIFDKISREFGTNRFNIFQGATPLFTNTKGIFLNPVIFSNFLTKVLRNNPSANLDNFVDAAINEELIHFVSVNLTTEQERIDINEELSKNNNQGYKNLKGIYKNLRYTTDSEKVPAIEEFIRINVQKVIRGEITEEAKQPQLKSIIGKIIDWLQSLFSDNQFSAVNKTLDFIQSELNNNQKNSNQVGYSLKAIDILQSDKAKQVFEKGKKNGWDLNKILTELQVPKEQKSLIFDYRDTYVSNIFNTLEKKC